MGMGGSERTGAQESPIVQATLDTLLHDGLRDIRYAGRKALRSLGSMSRVAQRGKIKAAFEPHPEEREGQVERLTQVFEAIGRRARASACAAMGGIAEEAEEECKSVPALDAGLLAAAQANEHYEIARYGTFGSWAWRAGNEGTAQLLGETPGEETRTDEILTGPAKPRLDAAARARALARFPVAAGCLRR